MELPPSWQVCFYSSGEVPAGPEMRYPRVGVAQQFEIFVPYDAVPRGWQENGIWGRMLSSQHAHCLLSIHASDERWNVGLQKCMVNAYWDRRPPESYYVVPPHPTRSHYYRFCSYNAICGLQPGNYFIRVQFFGGMARSVC